MMPLFKFNTVLPTIPHPTYGDGDQIIHIERCKRKFWTVENLEEMESPVPKKEKVEYCPSEHQYLMDGTIPEQYESHEAAAPWRGEPDGSMDVGMESMDCSAPVCAYQPPTPTIGDLTHSAYGVQSQESRTLPQVGSEEMADVSSSLHDGATYPFQLHGSSHANNRIEFCSIRCSGGHRSLVSNCIQCSCKEPYHEHFADHYVSDYY